MIQRKRYRMYDTQASCGGGMFFWTMFFAAVLLTASLIGWPATIAARAVFGGVLLGYWFRSFILWVSTNND